MDLRKRYFTALLETRKHAVAGLLLLALGTAFAAARAEISGDAADLLRRSIAAHSEGPARLRLVYRGAIASPDQSARPFGPFRRHPWTFRIAIDEGAGALAVDTDLAIDGDFRFRTPLGFADGRGFVADYTGKHYDPLSAFPAAADAYLPHRLLRTALETGRSGSVASEGRNNRLTYTSASGETRTLVFDRGSNLLLASRRPLSPSLYGDQVRETIYGSYRRIGGVMVPGAINLRVTNAIHGRLDRELRLAEAAPGGPSPAELTPPAGAARREPAPRNFETVELGRDVYLLRNAGTDGPFSYNVLVLLFEDHVMVVEAALDDATSRRVIETVARLAPGKPIRFLVQTHHHSDHIGGIRTYIANGTRIVAPRMMRALIDRIAATHSSIAPDGLARAPRAALVEEVGRERMFRDGHNEMRLYDLPSDHSAHMLVVHLPRQRVVYQGDLISAGELPLNATSRQFLDWLRKRRLPVATLAGLHGRTVAGEELETLLRENRLR